MSNNTNNITGTPSNTTNTSTNVTTNNMNTRLTFKEMIEFNCNASELCSAGCSIEDLLSFGYTLKDLIPCGYTTKDFYNININKTILIKLGYKLIDLKQGGYKIDKSDGFSLRNVYDAGYTMKEIENMGYGIHIDNEFMNPNSIITSITTSYGKNYSSLYQIALKMKQYGYTIEEMQLAGKLTKPPLIWDCSIELKRAGYSVNEIINNGYTLKNLLRNDSVWHNPTLLADIRACGLDIPVNLLKETGYSMKKVREMHYGYEEIRKGGYKLLDFVEYYGHNSHNTDTNHTIHRNSNKLELVLELDDIQRLKNIGFEEHDFVDAGIAI